MKYELRIKKKNMLLFPKKTIHNSLFIIRNSNLGFTFVELLAVISIFLVVGVFVVSIIVSAFRGNNKTNAIAVVQANGTYAIGQMSKLIRNSRSLDNSVQCGSIDNPIVANSIALIDVDGQKTTYSCTTDNNNKPIIASNGASLTDANSVKWTQCSFSCGRNTPSDFPVIGIAFALQSVSNGGSTFADTIASSSGVVFQTSVIMRNLMR